MVTIIGYLVGIAGMWLLSDSIWSISYYLDKKKNETFWRNHIIRVVRGTIAVGLITAGLLLVLIK